MLHSAGLSPTHPTRHMSHTKHYMSHHYTPHVDPLKCLSPTPLTFTRLTPHITCNVTRHRMSILTWSRSSQMFHSTGLIVQVPHITCHTSHITCHVTPHHVSHVTWSRSSRMFHSAGLSPTRPTRQYDEPEHEGEQLKKPRLELIKNGKLDWVVSLVTYPSPFAKSIS